MKDCENCIHCSKSMGVYPCSECCEALCKWKPIEEIKTQLINVTIKEIGMIEQICETCGYEEGFGGDCNNPNICEGYDQWKPKQNLDFCTPQEYIPKNKDRGPKNNVKEDKPQPSLIPLDVLIKVLEPAYRVGLKKYNRESWRKGFHTTTMMDACMRHLSKFYYEGKDLDEESLGEFGIEVHHLGAAIFCLISIYNTLETKPEFDDRPNKKEK